MRNCPVQLSKTFKHDMFLKHDMVVGKMGNNFLAQAVAAVKVGWFMTSLLGTGAPQSSTCSTTTSFNSQGRYRKQFQRNTRKQFILQQNTDYRYFKVVALHNRKDFSGYCDSSTLGLLMYISDQVLQGLINTPRAIDPKRILRHIRSRQQYLIQRSGITFAYDRGPQTSVAEFCFRNTAKSRTTTYYTQGPRILMTPPLQGINVPCVIL